MSEKQVEAESHETAEQEQAKVSDDTPELKTDEVIEVPWPDAEQIFMLKSRLLNLEDYLADFMLSYEKRKASLLSQISTMERSIYESADFLRKKINIDPSVPYELKIPQQQGEKAYFLRKDEE